MRYLRLTLSGTALFLLYLWVSVLLNSCNNNKPVESSEDQVEVLEEEMDGIDYTADEFEGDGDVEEYESKNEESTEEGENGEEESAYEENDGYEAGDYTAAPEKTKLEPRERKSTPESTSETRTKTFTATSGSSSNTNYVSSGEFMVIAGSYLLEDNAKNMIRKLNKMGYANAEIIYFDQSQYHSICAGRYSSRASAKEAAASLQSKGVDSYVHRKQN